MSFSNDTAKPQAHLPAHQWRGQEGGTTADSQTTIGAESVHGDSIANHRDRGGTQEHRCASAGARIT